MVESGIYRIFNVINNRCYIGSSINIKGRLKRHIYSLNKGNHHSFMFQRAYDKYGKDNFKFEILEIVERPENTSLDDMRLILLSREQYYLDLYQSYKFSSGYNILKICGSSLGRVHSIETRQKISDAGKGRKLSKESIAKRTESRKGYKHSVETIEKIRLANLGKNNHNYGKATPEYVKEKIRKALSGEKNYRYGTEMSEELKERLRTLNIGNTYRIGKKASAKTLKKMSDSRRGYVFSEEAKANMRGWKHTDETKSKIGEASRNQSSETREKQRLSRIKGVVNVTTGKEFESVKDAGIFYNVRPDSISRVCKGTLKTCGGYIWRYLRDNDSN